MVQGLTWKLRTSSQKICVFESNKQIEQKFHNRFFDDLLSYVTKPSRFNLLALVEKIVVVHPIPKVVDDSQIHWDVVFVVVVRRQIHNVVFDGIVQEMMFAVVIDSVENNNYSDKMIKWHN